MGTITLSLIIGLAAGLMSAIWQARRLQTGQNTRVMRNPDDSVKYGSVPVLMGVFLLWSVVFFVLALIPISIVNWIR